MVADIGERDEAVDQVIPVGAPAGQMEIEVDLGRRQGRHPHFGSAAARRPGGRHGSAVELGLDRLDLLVLRPELQGPFPLIARLYRPPPKWALIVGSSDTSSIAFSRY
jgi:hypothetical protein